MEVLRYTPGGVPLLSLQLRHRSEQREADGERQVDVTMSVVALGEPALAAAKLKQGQSIAVKGFLSRRSLKSDYPVLHVQRIKSL